MRRSAQEKAENLEAEVKQLRIDVETIKDLLDDENKKKSNRQSLNIKRVIF